MEANITIRINPGPNVTAKDIADINAAAAKKGVTVDEFIAASLVSAAKQVTAESTTTAA
jgi:phosphotransferase system HPr-like phosphotransfer protein